MAAELSGIEQLLAGRMGLDPISVGSPLISRATRQRMSHLGVDDISTYERWVRQSESELQSLIEEVTISESWFFRDERPYAYFRDFVRLRWLHTLLHTPLRVLSLPCAGGEEPYSIAITLRELGLPARRIQIDAADISARQLAIARVGVYSSNAFRGSDLTFRARHFHEHSLGYELDSSVRSMVRFFQANVLDPRLLEGSAPYDVVFCRNLLIYLDTAARMQVLATLSRLLAADGLLFVGHADRLEVSGVEPKFVPAGDPACFVYRLRGQGGFIVPPPLPQLEAARAMPALIAPGTAAPVPLPGVSATNAATDQPAAASHDSAPVDEPSLLDQAAMLANQGRYEAAVAACEQHLRFKGYSPEAYYLMGMICQAAGDRTRAEECFHKTVYLDPMHDEALLR